MARNKIKIEKLEAIASRSPEQPPPAGFTEYVQDLIENGLAKTNPKNRDTRSLSEIVSDIENDENKSRARKDFEIRVSKMADRMTHQKPLSVSNDASQSDSVRDVLPLHERIKFLRQS
jgi:hypothetical protein